MNNKSSHVPLILGLVFFAIGSIFAAIALGMATWTIVWASGTEVTEGTVLKMVRGGKGSKPVVEYEVGGKSYEVEGLLTTSPPAYRVGDKTAVLYKPQSPGEAVIDSFINRWLFPTIFGSIGGVFVLAGAGMLTFRILGQSSSRVIEPT